jgi:ferric-dicitrate binding protein FerR (iron transport regulator)
MADHLSDTTSMIYGISKEKIKELSEKWMKGTLTDEERALFESWYDQHTESSIQWPGEEAEEELRGRIYDKINAALHDEEHKIDPTPVMRRTLRIHPWWRVAAAVVAVTAGTFVWRAAKPREARPAVAAVLPATHQKAEKPADFIRHFTLPDGTHVVLQMGGRMDYPTQFNGAAREVSLSGEAYFDVAEDVSKPFIIHTGSVRTTVLGTAFNIRALPNDREIVVSVTKGKVKVEDNKKLLAVLTSNQQVKYQPTVAVVWRDSLNTASLVTAWTKQEMAFDGQSFDEVAERLGKRYGVDIRFNKESLKKCTIKILFDGTESLETVLNRLCTISNTSYHLVDGTTVLLDGEGCGN